LGFFFAMSAITKLGSVLHRLRKEKNLTQEKLAELSGLSRVQIAYLETGKRGSGRAGWDTITGLAKAFGVSSDEFAAMIAAETPSTENGERTRGRPAKAERTPTPTLTKQSKPAAKGKKSKKKGKTG
jgi:transcriptional regulator with XRE-family HTH domain